MGFKPVNVQKITSTQILDRFKHLGTSGFVSEVLERLGAVSGVHNIGLKFCVLTVVLNIKLFGVG